jgi:integrase
MPKLTKMFVSNVKLPDKGQIIYRDSALVGLGLRVTPAGCKSYVVEGRVNGVFRRVTLGRENQMTPSAARKKAQKVLATFASGKDPIVERSKKKIRGVNLRGLLAHYLSIRNVKPNTRKFYTNIIPRCLGDWLDKPVMGITREMVEQRHQELRKTTRQGTSGEAQANTVMRILGTLLNFAATNYEIDGKPIILLNPVKRLSHNRRWYQDRRRQTVIPDHKMPAWYSAVTSLRQENVRDYLLFLAFTGLRRNEAATLRWDDIDFESRIFIIREEITKNHHEHRLPFSDFLEDLLKTRYSNRGSSEYVFPGRGGKHHIVDSDHVISGVAKKAGCKFMLHDLRRGFLTMAERLDLSYVVLKKLANHAGRNDTTFGYIVVDIERLREPMQKITNELLRLYNARNEDQQENMPISR